MAIVTHINLLKKRRTKIVATIRPASASAEIIEQLVSAGVNVFRLNISHGNHEFHLNSYRLIREQAARVGLPVSILADLCGPKIRAGKFKGGEIQLVSGTGFYCCDGRVYACHRRLVIG